MKKYFIISVLTIMAGSFVSETFANDDVYVNDHRSHYGNYTTVSNYCHHNIRHNYRPHYRNHRRHYGHDHHRKHYRKNNYYYYNNYYIQPKHNYQPRYRSERTRSYGHQSYTPVIAGSVIGGIIGNQFGKGSGKKILTAAGALLGGSIGRDYRHRY